jgi:hypothetical protein
MANVPVQLRRINTQAAAAASSDILLTGQPVRVEENGRVYFGDGTSTLGELVTDGVYLHTNIATNSAISSAISTHVAAVDPHGDRAYADSLVVNMVETVNGVSGPDVVLAAADIASGLVVNEAGTTRSVGLADVETMVVSSNAGTVTMTIEPQASVTWAGNPEISFMQGGTGQIILAPGSGVTIRTSRSLNTYAQYSVISIKRLASDLWVCYGDTE